MLHRLLNLTGDNPPLGLRIMGLLQPIIIGVVNDGWNVTALGLMRYHFNKGRIYVYKGCGFPQFVINSFSSLNINIIIILLYFFINNVCIY